MFTACGLHLPYARAFAHSPLSSSLPLKCSWSWQWGEHFPLGREPEVGWNFSRAPCLLPAPSLWTCTLCPLRQLLFRMVQWSDRLTYKRHFSRNHRNNSPCHHGEISTYGIGKEASDAQRCSVTFRCHPCPPPVGFMTLEALWQMRHWFSKFDLQPKDCNIWFCLVALCYWTWKKASISGNNLNILLNDTAAFTESCYHWHSRHGQCDARRWCFLPKLSQMLLMKKCSWEIRETFFPLCFH